MAAPSTQWKENIGADEAARFAGYAAQFAEMQRRKSQRFGNGRALHRKQLLGLRAQLQVLDDLPAHARAGLFERARTFEAWVRLSNGGTDRASDARPDIRGFAIKLLGVQGAAALGGEARSQDFLLINHAAFSYATSHEFVALVMAASHGVPALLAHFVKRYGIGGAFKQLGKLKQTFGKPFSGFATEMFYTATPLACGDHACRVRLLPPAGERRATGAAQDWAQDIAQRLAQRPLTHELQLQFFVDERSTPIEDASVDWPESVAPYVTVARLTLLQQDVQTPEAQALQRQVEAAAFDPWCALAAHRPLGEVMRARKAVYHASQQVRGAA